MGAPQIQYAIPAGGGVPVGVSGTGTVNKLAKFSAATTIADSLIYDNGTNVGIGTASPGSKLEVAGVANTSVPIIGSFATTVAGQDLVFLRGGTSANYYSFARSDSNGALLIQGSQVGNNNIALCPTSGNVGIGTTSPGSKLDVWSTDTVGGSSASTARAFFTGTKAANTGASLGFGGYYTGTTPTIYSYIVGASDTATAGDFGGHIQFWTRPNGGSFTQQMTIASSGNVGIGTTSPAWKLNIASGAFNFFVDPFGSSVWNLGTSASAALAFFTGNTERARIDSSGNFGIGISPPAWAVANSPVLHVNTGTYGGGASSFMQFIANAYYDGATYRRIGADYASRFWQANGAFAWDTAATGAAGSAITFSTKMTVDASGNVGIGTTSPNATLSVYNASIATFSLWNSSNYSRLAVNGGDLYIDTGLGGSAGNTIFRRGSGTSESARIDSTGNVGIGTASPGQKLQVNGAVAVAGAATLGATASAGTLSLESGSTFRQYTGDGTGWTWAISRRSGSVTTDLMYVADNNGSLIVPTSDSYFYGVRVGRGAGAVSTNTAIGASALNANTTGLQNTAIGASALTAVVSGQNNTAVGYGALVAATGSTSTAVGAGASTNQTSGINNTSVGHQAGWANTINSNNVSVGQNAALYQTGASNTAVGASAMYGASGLSTGGQNTAVGHYALNANTTATSNSMLGFQAGASTTGGSRNTALGESALYANTTGTDNTAVGRYAAVYNTGNSNTAIGAAALNGVNGSSTGASNTAIGYNAATAVTTGYNNVCVGYGAGNTITTGGVNICIGVNATTAAASDSNKLVIGSSGNYVATNGAATTYYPTATAPATGGTLPATCGFLRVLLNGTYVKIPVYAD